MIIFDAFHSKVDNAEYDNNSDNASPHPAKPNASKNSATALFTPSAVNDTVELEAVLLKSPPRSVPKLSTTSSEYMVL